jgi:hypothetical protein
MQASQLDPAEFAAFPLHRHQLVTVLTLYRALGGGWQLKDDQWLHELQALNLRRRPGVLPYDLGYNLVESVK